MSKTPEKRSHHEPEYLADTVVAMHKSSQGLRQISECVDGLRGKKVCYTHNRRFGKKSINLLPGDFVVSADDIIITTVLGSCISVCFYSDVSAYCGMNHFMLPEPGDKYRSEKDIMHTDAAFYGINAMEMVINSMIKFGVRREYLKAKVFGGGNVIPLKTASKTVGEQNVEFVLAFLKMEKIPVTACSVGGDYARKIHFFTKTGEILLSRLGHGIEKKIMVEEESLRHVPIKREDIALF